MPAPELENYSEREKQLHDVIDHYARLMLKADRGQLQLDELDELLLTETSMRKQYRELGLSKQQLELMLAKTIQRLRSVDESPLARRRAQR